MMPNPIIDPVRHGYMEILVCPSNPPTQSVPPPCAYVVNAGQPDVAATAAMGGMPAMPADWRANGVFLDRFQDSMDSMMATDNNASNGAYYPYTNARPSSYHPGGVNMLFCDGHERWISQDIDYKVYSLLMSSCGAEVQPAGTTMAPNTAVWNYLRQTPLSDGDAQ